MTHRQAFAREFQASECRWTGRNLIRLLRQTGERPGRIDEMWSVLSKLGMGNDRRWPVADGAFDHGELWGRAGKPWAIVGHPYGLSDDEREWLRVLGRFGALRVAVDDRPSYYGHGTAHVRIELVEACTPFQKMPSTVKTRAAARAARRAFAEMM